jgi:hypothetical protein
MPRPPLIHLSTLKQFEALMSPQRFEVFECMRFMAPCAIADIARWLDKPADALYQHVHKLLEVGIVCRAGFRKSGNHTEELFDLTGDDVDFASLRPPLADQVMSLAGELFVKYARKTMQSAIDARAIRYDEQDRNLIITNFLAWLTREEYQTIRGLTKQIIQVINDARQRQSGDLYMCLNLVCPVARKTRGKTPRGGSTAGPRGTVKTLPRAKAKRPKAPADT